MGAWRQIFAKEGLRGVFFGWSPTFVGYSFQGAGKYGFYEVFKYLYGEKWFPSANKTVVYLGASASAEFLADIALCPWEAVKVRMQTTLPPYAHNMREGVSKVVAQEGVAGLYKGLVPLWGRQIPYTMVKFATFEKAVEQIYKYLGKPKEAYNGLQQTGVSFLGGYIAGIGCAVISHPAGTFPLPLPIPSSLEGGSDADPVFPLNRRHGLEAQQRPQGGRERRPRHVPHLWQHWLRGSLERPTRPYLHDWYAHGVPVAHLRQLQGVLGPADHWWSLDYEQVGVL